MSRHGREGACRGGQRQRRLDCVAARKRSRASSSEIHSALPASARASRAASSRFQALRHSSWVIGTRLATLTMLRTSAAVATEMLPVGGALAPKPAPHTFDRQR